MLFWTRFGKVLGTVFGAFWKILGGFWGFQKEFNFKAKLERVLKPNPVSRRHEVGAGVGRGSPSWGRVKVTTVYWSQFLDRVGQALGWSAPVGASSRTRRRGSAAQAQAAAAHSKAPPAHSAGPISLAIACG